ncbi:MAG: DNA polymerase III subunit gamma/tau [Firmicutes bacterium]|nr:DNA polymerase III subunit gamma/tau [Bacillota bacterium]
MYTALYRTERPETFDEILGQEHIVKILKNQVATGTVGHAYLFCGTRGTGKTSTARILAKAVNCTGEGEKPCGCCPSCLAIKEGSFIDMIEIDAASNNGVDNVRELRESVNYPPAVGKKKVYIIDEAHMLTTQALNALLKTLEEPPENVMFILATTDPQKLLQTILSRCLRLDFRRIPDVKIAEHMKKICDARGVKITDDALRLLASNADGSVRDGLSLLDQCLSGGGDSLDRDTVLEYLGTVADDFFIKLTELVVSGDAASGIVMLDEILRDGKDVKQLVSDWLSHYRSLLVSKYVDNPENILNMSTENVAKLIEQSRGMDISEIERGILTLSKTVNDVRYSSQPRILMELAIVMLAGAPDLTVDADLRANLKKNDEKTRISEKNAISDHENAKKAVDGGSNPVKQPEKTRNLEKSEHFDQESAAKATPAEAKSAHVEAKALSTAAKGNLSAIWEAVWDRVGSRGSMVMAKLSSSLAGISESDFKVIFTNKYAMEQVEKNRDDFVNAMEAETGKALKMVTVFAEPSEDEPAQQSFLGEEVPLKDIVNIGASDSGVSTAADDDGVDSGVNIAADDERTSDEEFEALARELEADLNVKPIIE